MNKINSKNEITNRKNKFTLLDNNEDESYYDETTTPEEKEEKKIEHPNPELENKINKIMDELDEKYLENREYIESKVDNWINAILDD